MVHRALAPGFASISWWTPDSVGPLGDLLLEALGDALRDVGALHGAGAAAGEGGGRDERDGAGDETRGQMARRVTSLAGIDAAAERARDPKRSGGGSRAARERFGPHADGVCLRVARVGHASWRSKGNARPSRSRRARTAPTESRDRS